MVVASKDKILEPLPIQRYKKNYFQPLPTHRSSKNNMQPLATQRSSKNVRRTTDFLPFTSGITHKAVMDNDQSRSIATGGWSFGKRELIINAWRNKFMC